MTSESGGRQRLHLGDFFGLLITITGPVRSGHGLGALRLIQMGPLKGLVVLKLQGLGLLGSRVESLGVFVPKMPWLGKWLLSMEI